jgi:hypothetical protein
MRNSFSFTDGFYFLLLLISFAVSLWLGDTLRLKIQEGNWNQKLSIFTGAFVEILITGAGVLIGSLLIKILATNA